MAPLSSGNSLMVDGSRQYVWAILVTLGMVGAVGTALVFEHGFGFVPCALCLEQRIPYYAAIPLGMVAALAAWRTWPGCVSRGLLAIVGLLMLYGLVLAVYHSGVEWKFWDGPTDCAISAGATAPTDASNLLSSINENRAPSCDQAAGRFLGLSFAGWNVVSSLILAVAALRAAVISAE